MSRSRKAFGIVFLIAFVASNAAPHASAAQTLRKIMTIAQTCKLQASATEVLALMLQGQSIAASIKSKLAGPAVLPETRLFRAEVLGVHRSVAGLRAGEIININDFAASAHRQTVSFSGGTIVETAYLARLNDGSFRLAALDRSFKPIDRKLCHEQPPPSRQIAGNQTDLGQH